jgi:hypothetical protein
METVRPKHTTSRSPHTQTAEGCTHLDYIVYIYYSEFAPIFLLFWLIGHVHVTINPIILSPPSTSDFPCPVRTFGSFPSPILHFD